MKVLRQQWLTHGQDFKAVTKHEQTKNKL